jgi:hypothetical protein
LEPRQGLGQRERVVVKMEGGWFVHGLGCGRSGLGS